MDDKTFIASFVAKEATRINEELKEMINNPEPPSEEKREAVMQDIETTLKRLQSALAFMTAEMLGEDEEEKDVQPS